MRDRFTLAVGHGVMVVDFNGDGFDEVVAGGGQGAIVWYENSP